MNYITAVMLVFSLVAAADRIFGGRFGLGKEYEKGFMLLGNMALSMIGMIVVSPLIAELLQPTFDYIYNITGIDPSVIPASLFANDMGGASLATEITRDKSLGMLNAYVVSSMMGCTVSFTVPYALGIIKKDIHKEFFLGVLCGMVTIPIGVFASGIMVGIPVGVLLYNLLPLIILSAIIASGLMLAPTLTVRIFSWIGMLIKIIIGIGLALGCYEFLTGNTVVDGLADVGEGADICFNAAVVLSGAFPLMYVVSKLLARPINAVGRKVGINETSAMGFVSSLVTNATTLEMMNRMDKKGIVMNSAFAVSASFVFGSHLAFTAAFDDEYIGAMILAKLVAGVCALGLSIIVYKRQYKR